MSKMKELYTEINELLNVPLFSDGWLSCQQIADKLGCPVSIVNNIVEQQWINDKESALL